MVVRMRATRSHRNNRRSHHALKGPRLSTSPEGVVHLRHRAYLVNGVYMYRGRALGKVEKTPAKKATPKAAPKAAKKATAKKAA
ncbi:MAG: hypothetical protein RI911_915 [Candidatus Parcubacteria bacterium]|jgi:ribosomal protein L32